MGDEDVLIYIDGYSAYQVYASEIKPAGHSFASGVEDQEYSEKGNLARLFHFQKSDSHRDHLDWIHTFGIYNWPEQLLENELQKEMERASQER